MLTALTSDRSDWHDDDLDLEQLHEQLLRVAARLPAARRSAGSAPYQPRLAPRDYARQPDLWLPVLRERCAGLFTPRQEEVIAHRLTGWTYGQIGTRLYVSPATVKSHVEAAVDRHGLDHPDQLPAFVAAHLIDRR
jgi:DNA-binding NarL/FixJ family response regulator